jgi:hypothetical protein
MSPRSASKTASKTRRRSGTQPDTQGSKRRLNSPRDVCAESSRTKRSATALYTVGSRSNSHRLLQTSGIFLLLSRDATSRLEHNLDYNWREAGKK